jgi:hypothetical protein
LAKGFFEQLRTCGVCGERVPWGTPQCLHCRSYTAWRRLLAGFGLLVGAGTVATVVLATARVAFLPPPQPVQEMVRARSFLDRVQGTSDGGLVLGAGPCPDRADATVCVRLGGRLDGLEPRQRDALRERLEAVWREMPDQSAPNRRLVLLDARGSVI